MRHYASIPFGGKSITDDIKSECQITERLAENIKLAYGACMPEKLQSLSEKVIQIRYNSAEPDKKLPVKYLSEIISARVEEIIMAVLYEIQQSGFADMLRSGIVVTGGGAQLANLGNFIYDISGYRVRTGYPKNLFSCQGCENISETTAATSTGLILAAMEEHSLNCAVSREYRGAETIVENMSDAHQEAEDSKSEEHEEEHKEFIFSKQDMDAMTTPAASEPKAKPEKKGRNGIRLTWTKFTDFCGSLYDNVNQEGV